MIYVFAGPSISEELIKNNLPDAIVLPPVRAADILSLLVSESFPRPSCLLILDGYFYSTLSVRHKEIIYAIKQGIPVFGASSMGALRAAELNDYGMVGLGRIYQYYSTNPVTSDDEVAILHSQSPPYQPLSIPLINIRLTLEDLVAANKLTFADASTIIREVSSIHFSNRTSAFIDTNDTVERLCPGLSSIIIDWKQRDALLAVSSLPHLLNECQSDIPSDIESVSLGTHPINFFMDTDSARYVKVGDTGVLYTPSYPKREASMIDIFKSLNLMAALHLSRVLNVKPSDRLRDACYEVIVSLGQHTDKIPLNDYSEIKRLSSNLASLLTLYSGLTDHSAILGHQQALSDNSVMSSVFMQIHSIDQDLISHLVSCVSGGSNTDFAEVLIKSFESGRDQQ